MADPTYLSICQSIRDVLGAAAIFGASNKNLQAPDQLTASIADVPALQVYPDEDGSLDSEVDRTTFRGGVRQTVIVVYADFYAHQLASLDEDYAAMVTGWDQLKAIIQSQDAKPYFGIDGLKAFGWSAKRTLFQYEDAKIRYVGVRFTFRLRFF